MPNVLGVPPGEPRPDLPPVSPYRDHDMQALGKASPRDEIARQAAARFERGQGPIAACHRSPHRLGTPAS